MTTTDPKRPADPFANIVNLSTAVSTVSTATDQKLFVSEPKVTPESTQEDAQSREISRKILRDSLRTKPRQSALEKPRYTKRAITSRYPSRDAIQEFSFLLRDDLKVKVQAEVPAAWQKELEDMAHRLDVGKLELYRYILGSFLGKVDPDEPVAS